MHTGDTILTDNLMYEKRTLRSAGSFRQDRDVYWQTDRKVTPGEIRKIFPDRRQVWEFRVTNVALLPDASFPIMDVFGPTNRTRLNLITCGGKFNRKTGEYPDRVVAYTEFFSLTRR